MDAGAGEGGLVHEGGDGDFWGEAWGEGFFCGGEEEMAGATDAPAEDDDVGVEGLSVLIEGESEVAAEVLEGLACAAVGGVWVVGRDRAGRGGSGRVFGWAGVVAAGGFCDGRNFGLEAGKILELMAEEAGGDEVFDGGAVVGKVPDFSAGRDAWVWRHGDVVAYGEGASDASAESDADGALKAFGRAGADFAEEEGGGVVDEADLGGWPAESLGYGGFEVDAEQRWQLMLHVTDAVGVVEGAGHGECGSG